jgi:glycosyltransferase involved in cell wall biosynthesis
MVSEFHSAARTPADRTASPRFTVVMPAHNTGPLVAHAIRSVLQQTCGDFELIVIDDGSTDGTATEVRGFTADPRVRLVEQVNRGPSAARNAGIALARGEYISMLDSDDMWLPRYLEVMGAALDRDPSAGLAYTDAWVLDEPTGRIRRTTMMHYQRPPAHPPADSERFLDVLLDRNFVYTSVTVRRDVLDAVGGFDERLWTGEDWELWLRIVAAGYRALRPADVLAIHRVRPGSLSTDLPRMIEGVCEVYRIIEREWNTSDRVRELARTKRAPWERRLRLYQDPVARRTPLETAAQLARTLKRMILARWLWLPQVPPELAAALAAVGDGTADGRDSEG